MPNNNPIISGSGMAVLLGVGLFVGAWFTGETLTFLQKLGLVISGIVLIFLGLKFSKG
jgi:drug/metabolite transporter (DMT)-like permease